MIKQALFALALLGTACSAAAQERAGTGLGAADRFWVQERPLSDAVSTDLLARDRHSVGGLGYGINLAPPPAVRTPLSLSLGGPHEEESRTEFAQLGAFSINNWRFGIDVMEPTAGGRIGSVTQFAMNYGGPISNRLAFSVGPTVSLGGAGASALLGSAPGSGRFMSRLGGDAGVRDYGLRGTAVYNFSDNWALTGVLGYRRSVGEPGVSSSDEQFFSVLGLGYRF